MSIIDRIAIRSELAGFSCFMDMHLLPNVFENCEVCQGEYYNYLDEQAGRQPCKLCGGNGVLLVLPEEKLAKVRRYARARHTRRKDDLGLPARVAREERGMPANPLFTQDLNAQAIYRHFRAINRYEKRYGARNERIGELVIIGCGEHACDIFMDLVEGWELCGGGLEVQGEDVLLCASGRSRTWLCALHTPQECLQVNLPGVKRRGGGQLVQELRALGVGEDGSLPAAALADLAAGRRLRDLLLRVS